jgi:site-specific recombinase XerD
VLHVEEWVEYLEAVEQLALATVEKRRRAVVRMAADWVETLRRGGDGSALARDEEGRVVVDPAVWTRADVERHVKRLYYARRGGSEVIATAIQAVRSLGRWLVGHGLVERSPAAELRQPKSYRAEYRVLTAAEVRRLIGLGDRALPDDPRAVQVRVMAAVQYDAGLRSSELVGLLVDDLAWDPVELAYTVRVRRAKAATRDHTVPLTPEVSRLVGVYLGHVRPRLRPGPLLFPGELVERMAPQRWARLFRARCDQVGILPEGRRLRPHLLRHTLATLLLRAGWPIRDVQRMLRHASIQSTEVYLHSDDERLVRLRRRKNPLREGRERVAVGPAVRALLEQVAEVAR